MISPDDISNLNTISKENNLEFSTLAFNIKDQEDYQNKNIVKVYTKNKISSSSISIAQNFSRKLINKSKYIYHHYGIYCYKFSNLKKFVNLEQSKNEKNEKLEQLRAIDNNINISVLLAKNFSLGIDTKEDLDNYRKIIN